MALTDFGSEEALDYAGYRAWVVEGWAKEIIDAGCLTATIVEPSKDAFLTGFMPNGSRLVFMLDDGLGDYSTLLRALGEKYAIVNRSNWSGLNVTFTLKE